MTLLVLEKPGIYHVHGLLNYHKCGVFVVQARRF